MSRTLLYRLAESVPGPPPIVAGSNLTPPALEPLLGPLIARDNEPQWPSNYNDRLDDAVNRMITEVAAGSYSYITDSSDGDNPHYGPLRMVTMRNIRAGLPLDETEPGFAAALKITREFIRLYVMQSNWITLSFRYTNWCDAEIVYWLFKDDPGDNGLLADQCYNYLWAGAAWLSYHMGPQYGGPVQLHGSGDERVLALVLEMMLTADRIGIPHSAPSHLNGQLIVYKPTGVTSWAEMASWVVDNVVGPLQNLTYNTWGTTLDPRGLPILYGNIRVKANGIGATDPPEPYPILFFMAGMLANALLKTNRQVGHPAAVDRAYDLLSGVRQHYEPSLRMLPYVSHNAPSGSRFVGTGQEGVLNNFWVRPLMELWQLTGESDLYTMALELLDRSTDPGYWTFNFKQSQQVGSASESQSAQALLAGLTP